MNDVWKITSPEMKFSENAFYLFRKKVVLRSPESGKIYITADARYKLWINGRVASFGPQKGDGHTQYYDTVEISPYLQDGENDFVVEVLQLAAPNAFYQNVRLTSVPRTGNLLLLLWGEVKCREGVTAIRTDGSWECAKDTTSEFLPTVSAWFVAGNQRKKCGEILEWKPAGLTEVYEEELPYGESLLWVPKAHELPKQRYDISPITRQDGAGNYDFGRLTTGFIRIKLRGKGSVKLSYAECYVYEEKGEEIKGDRTDCRGEILGDYDIFEVNGEATYETFWFRCFRFIKVEGDVEILSLEVAETGYPLQVQEGYDFGDERDNKLWDICINTLKNCMHETYEDCPYYEQMQYAMDTYTQMLFTMCLTEDIRLGKQAIQDFAASLTVGGIPQSRFPSVRTQYITGFGLYFVYMLDALEENRGERAFVKKYLGAVDCIFSSFEELRGMSGLVEKSKYWDFVDWAEGWERGVPPSRLGDGLTVYNLMYVVALEKAARLCRVFARNDTAAEYENRAAALKLLVKEKCYSVERGLYADTNRRETYSQQAQVWAVLANLDEPSMQKRILTESVRLLTKSSFAFSYLTFRAFEKAGVYELSEDMMNTYRGLLDLHCTSIPETPTASRSECHAWGAVSIYEMTRVVLGVKNGQDGVFVKPYCKGRAFARGTAYTRFGGVQVAWKIENGGFFIEVEGEKGVKISLELPNGEKREGVGKITCFCDL